MSRKISFFVLLGIILIIGVLFYRVMVTFLVPLFLAALFVVIFAPLQRWIYAKCGGRRRTSAGLATAAVLLIVLLPALLIGTLAALEGIAMVDKLDVTLTRQKLTKLRQTLGLEMPRARELREVELKLDGLADPAYRPATENLHAVDVDQLLDLLANVESTLNDDERESAPTDPFRAALEDVKSAPATTLKFRSAVSSAQREFRVFKTALLGGSYETWLKELANPTDEQLQTWNQQLTSFAQKNVLSATGATGAFLGRLLLGTVILVVAVYFFFADGRGMVEALMRLSPLDDRYEQELLAEFQRASRAVVLATLLSAAVQGLLAGLGFWVAGVGSVFLLMLLTTMLAMVPFVGAVSVWAPTCLWLYFYEERTLAAVLLAVYCAAIVSQADNVIKPVVLHGQSNLHPLLALLSVLGGVGALGPIGILVGPMVVVFLRTLLNILHRELTSLEKDGERRKSRKHSDDSKAP